MAGARVVEVLDIGPAVVIITGIMAAGRSTIAQAWCERLSRSAHVLIVDEPTASLDRRWAGRHGHRPARRNSESGTSVLAASPDPGFIDRSRILLTLD